MEDEEEAGNFFNKCHENDYCMVGTAEIFKRKGNLVDAKKKYLEAKKKNNGNVFARIGYLSLANNRSYEKYV